MAEEEWIVATQDTLGKLISKPRMTEKYLKKPPFRFLHDIVMEVTRSTGFGQGLYSTEESDAAQLSDKQAKVDFLNKAISVTCFALGETVDVSANKIVAGLEAEKTNAFLQKLNTAATTCVKDNQAKSDDAVRRVQAGESVAAPKKKKEKPKEEAKAEEPKAAEGGGGDDAAAAEAEEKKKKDEARRKKRDEEKKRKAAEEEAAKAAGGEAPAAAEGGGEADAAAEEERKKKEKRDEEKKKKEEDRKRREERKRKEQEAAEEEERKRQAAEAEAVAAQQAAAQQAADADADAQAAAQAAAEQQQAEAAAAAQAAQQAQMMADQEEENQRMRASPPADHMPEGGIPSAPGSAAQGMRPPPGQEGSPEDIAARAAAEGMMGRGDEEQRRPDRPRTAGRRPPKVQSKVQTSSESTSAAPSAAPVILAEGAKDDDDDDCFEDPANDGPGLGGGSKMDEGGVHGKLVSNLLAEKKKEEEARRLKEEEEKTREEFDDGQGKGIRMGKLKRNNKKSDSMVAEVDTLKLGDTIQALCQAANPLGKSIDLVHQDIAHMGKELDHWKSEYREASDEFANQIKTTEDLLQPLYQKIAELDDHIAEKKAKIRNSRSRISKNDQKIQVLLESVVGVNKAMMG